MRILILNQVNHPDVAATAQHAHDLARHLVANGHEVTAIASRSLYGQRGAGLPKRSTVDGVEIVRVGKSLFGKAGIVARIADFALFYLAAGTRAVFGKRYDVVIGFTTPPFITLLGWPMRVLRGTHWVYWVMDMYPDVAVACGVMKPKGLATRFFTAINRFCLKRADRTVVLGRCMEQRVRDHGATGDNVRRISVWSTQEVGEPIAHADNPYRKEWELGDKFVVMYSGNFGIAHDVDTMCQAAERLKDDERVRFVFAGGGKKKAEVERFVEDHKLTNCVLAPYQPLENLHESLSCADLHLASLLEGAEGMIVPCKLFGVMAARRACAFIGHSTSELSRVLDEHDCGFTVREGDVDGLVTIIEQLADDRERCATLGENAFQALHTAYDSRTCCEQWRELLEGLEPEKGANPSNAVDAEGASK